MSHLLNTAVTTATSSFKKLSDAMCRIAAVDLFVLFIKQISVFDQYKSFSGKLWKTLLVNFAYHIALYCLDIL